jgi:hypothetical protein
VAQIRYDYVISAGFVEVGDVVLGESVIISDDHGRADPSHACGECGARWSPEGEVRPRGVRRVLGYE